MKNILTLVIILLCLTSCDNTQDTYTINGNAKGLSNGIRMRLAKIDSMGRQVIKDSAIVMNETFSITGSIDEPSIYFLSADGSPGNVIFMLENSPITIDFNTKIPMESVVSGSASQEGYEAFKAGMLKYKDEGAAIMERFRALKDSAAPVSRDAIAKAMQDLRTRQGAYPLQFVKENNDAFFSLNLIQLESSRPQFDAKGYSAAFDNFTPKLKSSKKGKLVREKLDALLEALKKTAYLDIGQPAPNFEAPDVNGDLLSLNAIKGKVTIIDFWAAWCGPCRRENPNVVNIYNKFHDKGLEIIGVSLDGQSRQQDPKKAWLDAVKKDGLTWHHVSNLQYFNDPVAKQYNIRAIPATFILDAQGTIVAKNLRGKALEQKIEALLGSK